MGVAYHDHNTFAATWRRLRQDARPADAFVAETGQAPWMFFPQGPGARRATSLITRKGDRG